MKPLRCISVFRDAENLAALDVYFNRRVTDEEMRYLHEVLERAACLSSVLFRPDARPTPEGEG